MGNHEAAISQYELALAAAWHQPAAVGMADTLQLIGWSDTAIAKRLRDLCAVGERRDAANKRLASVMQQIGAWQCARELWMEGANEAGLIVAVGGHEGMPDKDSFQQSSPTGVWKKSANLANASWLAVNMWRRMRSGRLGWTVCRLQIEKL